MARDGEEAESVEDNAVEEATEGQRNSLGEKVRVNLTRTLYCLVVEPFLPVPVSHCEAITAVAAVNDE